MQHLKSYFMTQMFFWNNNEEGCSVIHLIQYILVQVRHVTLTGNWAIIIIPEVLLQSDWIMRDTQDCAQVVRQHLKSQPHHNQSYYGSFNSLRDEHIKYKSFLKALHKLTDQFAYSCQTKCVPGLT